MIIAERTAAQSDGQQQEAISIASLSQNDEMIQSLLMFDQNAIFSPRASIRVELDE